MKLTTAAKMYLERDAEFELEEIAYALSEAKEEGKNKVFTVYKKEEPLTGMVMKKIICPIRKANPTRRMAKVTKEHRTCPNKL